MSHNLRVVSLFSGVGGLDFGFEAAGFENAVAVEMDRVACRTMRLNRPDWNILECDIHEISSEKILEAANAKEGEIDVLIGGPPCQPFSKSGYWFQGGTKRLEDPRADTLTAYLRVLRDLRPKAFLLENVYGLVYKGKDEGLRYLLEGIENINQEVGTNYRINWKALNAVQYGVPQSRERVFLIGSRDGREFRFPTPTHCKAEEIDLLSDREPYRTAWDAIGDLPEYPNENAIAMTGKWADLLPTIPEGQNYLWHTNRLGGMNLFGWRTRYWSFLLKLAKDQPSWTIQAQPGSSIGPFHWKNRKLSVQEMCRLQTFPEGLQFDCGRTDAQKMLGNAVPSLLAEILAEEIRSQLLDAPSHSNARNLLPPKRIKVPPKEKVLEVPDKYLNLLGDHADHPGTKKAAVG